MRNGKFIVTHRKWTFAWIACMYALGFILTRTTFWKLVIEKERGVIFHTTREGYIQGSLHYLFGAHTSDRWTSKCSVSAVNIVASQKRYIDIHKHILIHTSIMQFMVFALYVSIVRWHWICHPLSKWQSNYTSMWWSLLLRKKYINMGYWMLQIYCVHGMHSIHVCKVVCFITLSSLEILYWLNFVES